MDMNILQQRLQVIHLKIKFGKPPLVSKEMFLILQPFTLSNAVETFHERMDELWKRVLVSLMLEFLSTKVY
jgi:hypothetical protein